jgi:hypothetical protein
MLQIYKINKSGMHRALSSPPNTTKKKKEKTNKINR